MAYTNIVNLSKLRRASRIDADRYQIKYLKLESNLDNIQRISKLKNLVSKTIRTGSTPPDRNLNETDDLVTFIKTDTVREGLIDYDNSDHLPERSINQSDILVRNEILLTIIGAHFDIVGRAGIHLQTDLECVTNQNIAVIRANEKLVNPFYLMVFLNSKFGREQLWMLSRQTEQVNLNNKEVEEVKVPILPNDFQSNIEKVVKQAYGKNQESKKLYCAGGKLLLDELGLSDFVPPRNIFYKMRFSNVIKSERLDAEYFHPSFYQLIEKLENRTQLKTISQLISSIRKGIEVGADAYVNYGKEFIRVSNLSVTGLVGRDQQYISGELYQQLKDNFSPRLGELLLTKDATPGIAFVVKERIEGIISSGILCITVNENIINKEYFALCINNIVGKLQIDRYGGGSVIIHLKPKQIRMIQIPILNRDIQDKIGLLIKKSIEARIKCSQLLNSAKLLVEQEIDNEIAKHLAVATSD